METLILERKDRENGTSHLWVSCDGRRARFVMATASLDSREGHQLVELMAAEACRRIAEATERGRLQLEVDDVDGGIS